MSVIETSIATAKRLIDRYGEACTWIKKSNGAPADPAKPWKAGASKNQSFDCTLLLMPSNRINLREIVKALKGNTSEVTDGYMQALLPGDCGFIPSINDVIIRSDGSTSTLMNIDRLAPNGSTIYYVLGMTP